MKIPKEESNVCNSKEYIYIFTMVDVSVKEQSCVIFNNSTCR
jgi:hypothetical protein